MFATFFIIEKDTKYAFNNLNKHALLKVFHGYKDYLKGKNTFPTSTYIEGIGIECNDEKIIFLVKNLYRLWSKSPYCRHSQMNADGFRFSRKSRETAMSVSSFGSVNILSSGIPNVPTFSFSFVIFYSCQG